MTTDTFDNIDETVPHAVEIEAGKKAVKSELNAGKKVQTFVKTLKDLDPEAIEHIINGVLDGVERHEAAVLDKRFQTASRRELDEMKLVFGCRWSKDDQRAFFKIPKSRNTTKDPLVESFNNFRKNLNSSEALQNHLNEVMKAYKAAGGAMDYDTSLTSEAA